MSNCDWHVGNNIDYLLTLPSPCSQRWAVTFSSLLLSGLPPPCCQPPYHATSFLFCLQSRPAEGQDSEGLWVPGDKGEQCSSLTTLGGTLVRTCLNPCSRCSLYPPLSSISSKSLVRPLRGSVPQLSWPLLNRYELVWTHTGCREPVAIAGLWQGPCVLLSVGVSAFPILYPLLILLNLASVTSWPVLGKHVPHLSPSLLPPGALGTQAIKQRAVVRTLDSSQHPKGYSLFSIILLNCRLAASMRNILTSPCQSFFPYGTWGLNIYF